eukprot:TRINITY_DN2247_c0_g1_i4.p1 TRINITY_DN2247_c0_g1~~TRINITY_DN2247_c0_g1_i4.p1  ORF type:complete len:580 (-),score=112.34 TRINITY_DN2247_c0_g1_i4:492-2231(-)
MQSDATTFQKTLGAAAVLGGAYVVKKALETNPETVPILDQYDYVIVGAGSSGCVIANRLSQDPSVSVLLLEAGIKDNDMKIKIPIAAALLQKTEFDYQYRTEPQPEMNNRISCWPRGRTLGGSSAINYMLYTRGDQNDYNGWAQAGCEGWSYEEVLPYFKKSETFEGGDDRYHGRSGEHVVTLANPPTLPTQLFVKAAQQYGLPFNQDYHGPDMMGVCFSQLSINKGQRQSMAHSFIHPIRHRKNLTVAACAQATRILFDGDVATGIEYLRSVTEWNQEEGKPPGLKYGPLSVVRARREVIISCGALGSPQLLMLSGIGPKKELERVGIRCIADLPTGQNLHDHLFVGTSYECTKPVSLDEKVITAPTAIVPNVMNYALFGKGPFASQILEAMVFHKTDPTLFLPDLQFHFVSAGANPKVKHNMELDTDTSNLPPSMITIMTALLHPKSIGQLTLKSSSPFDHCLIQPNYFKNPDDVKLLIKGIRMARAIMKQPALDVVRGREIVDERAPGASNPDSDEYLDYIVRNRAVTIYHPCGTCKMGAASDPTAVVDPQLRVKGFRNLRVADCRFDAILEKHKP